MIKYLFYSLLIATMLSCNSERYDVIIYSGTPAGITTAISLAQKGKKVLLIEQTNHLGGMYAGGLMTAEIMHMQKGCISGLAQDYYIKLGYNTPEGYFHKFQHGQAAYFFECKGAEKTFLEWTNEYREHLSIIYDLRIIDLKKNGKEIASITLNNNKKYKAKYFVDCSYEGDLMRLSGVSYAYGRESQDAYNEQYAGIRMQTDTNFGTTVDPNGKRLPWFNEREGLNNGDADDCVNAYNYRCVLTKVADNQVPFVKPDDYDSTLYYAIADYLKRNPTAKPGNLFGVIRRGNGKTGFNTRQDGEKSISVGLLGMQRPYPMATHEQRDSIKAFYKKYTRGLFYFLSNDLRVPDTLRLEMAQYGYAKDEFVKNNNFPYYFYIREALRLQGEYIMTEHDILTHRKKEDAVLLGSHWLDCHSIQKIALSDTSYINEGNIWVEIHDPYEIPYRCMLPKRNECQNLLVPVCVSSSHVAFCSIRLESTWMQLGHAAGVAISMALQNKTSIYDIDIKSLQENLREEKMVVNIEELGR
jgi:hypothetical protein